MTRSTVFEAPGQMVRRASSQLGTESRRVYAMIAEYPGVHVIAQEIADECELPLRYASACAHDLARQGRIERQTGGQGRQAEFWVNP